VIAAGVAVVAAVVPGLAAWVLGRRLLAARDENTLAERVLAHHQRLGAIAGIAIGLVLLVGGVHGFWSLPLLLLGALAGSFPLRKRVRAETWGFGAYVSHMLRFGTAAAGLVALLAATPALIRHFGGVAGWVLLPVLAFWAARSVPVFLFLARARPLHRADLAPHLDRVVAASGEPAPRIFQAGARGGRFVNAFAFPALSPAVLFTDDLLAQFTPEEVAAVFAHEVAHLEHYKKKGLWRRWLSLALLIGLAVFVVPGLAAWQPAYGATLVGAWAIAMPIATLVSLAAHRSHEAESDVRAVALCGDAEALVRALVKLTALSVLPRRWSGDFERQSSHPSLSRRIQAIRQAAGIQAAGLGSPVVLAGRDPGQFVVLDRDRAFWLEGADAGVAADPEALRASARRLRAASYSELVDLHLEVARGAARLRAATAAGEKWTLALRPDSVAAAQAALDLVDLHLAPYPKAAGVHPLLVSAVGLAMMLVGVAGGHPLLVMPAALVASFRGGASPTGAAGATAAVAALLASSTGGAPAPAGDLARPGLLVAGLLGLVTAVEVYRKSPGQRGKGAIGGVVAASIVAAVALVGLAATTLGGAPLLQLHQAAGRAAPAASLAGLAAALAFSCWPWARRAAAACALAATGVAFLGSSAFARVVLRDPMLVVDVAEFEVRPLELSLMSRHSLDGYARDLRLSPGGQAFAIRGWDEETEAAEPSFQVGRFGGPVQTVEAHELRFADDERILMLSAPDADRSLELRLAPIQAPDTPVWTRGVPAMLAPALVVDGANRWRLTGAAPARDAAVLLEGAIDEADVTQTRFALPERGSLAMAVSADGGVTLEYRYGGLGLAPLLPIVGALTGATPTVPSLITRLTHEGPRPLAETGLHVQCPSPSGDGRIFCLAFDGSRTVIFGLEAEAGRFHALGALDGRLLVLGVGRGGRLAAWTDAGRTVLLETDTRRVRPLPFEVTSLATTDDPGTLGVLRAHDDGSSSVEVYAID
jgi:Zn-dependent protease with chaperone function